MTYSVSSTASYPREIDADLKGEVDFNFFGASDTELNNNTTQTSVKRRSNDAIVEEDEYRLQPKSKAKGKLRDVSPLNLEELIKDPKDEPRDGSSIASTASPRYSPSQSSSRGIRSQQSKSRELSPEPQPEIPSSRSRSSSQSSSTSTSTPPSTDQSRSSSSHSRSRKESVSPPKDKNRTPSPSRTDDGDAVGQSDSDVTDVSPLLSPVASANVSPAARRKMLSNKTANGNGGRERCEQEDDQDQISAQLIMNALMAVNRQCSKNRKPRPAWVEPNSKSYPSDVIKHQLIGNFVGGTHPRSQPNSKYVACKRPHHAALNRKKEQQRIYEENMAIARRIRQIRPTPGITRDEQLRGYDRQNGIVWRRSRTASLTRPASRLTVSSSDGFAPLTHSNRSHRPDWDERGSTQGQGSLRRSRSSTQLSDRPQRNLPSPCLSPSVAEDTPSHVASKPPTGRTSNRQQQQRDRPASASHNRSQPSNSHRSALGHSSRSDWISGW